MLVFSFYIECNTFRRRACIPSYLPEIFIKKITVTVTLKKKEKNDSFKEDKYLLIIQQSWISRPNYSFIGQF
jgi:hypothetical protein